ncbi:AAA family ATPase CDC6 [Aspergillus clavatus NRRL 1]|uniref:Cell division control protein n=1 Tax=Aspergillus clavatus (strain ATCC 1007 / CBS 513.65 / DSM 816 / NCTC 3887 / NRRL 1 / QM 1276 / 107) TaxID=344612 RepID=A1CDB8_ASPCL|nr:cell division control protein Cdc6, putative [Aspergillus clavatus NRRL 1]EAW11845.1 cell division control protein Cdc6, putative [Aspergillus clavatus NRRL 1]
MAVSVLGKRQRSAIEAEVSTLPVRSSSRRRTQPPRILQQDNEPSVSSTRQLRSRTRNTTLRKEESELETKSAPSGAPKIKHVVRITQITSPSKTNPQPRNSELVNDENTQPVEFKTPSKSRYRDALDSPPITPKHRVQVGGSKALTPRTPRQISTPTTAQTIYTNARQLFARGASSGRLIGRDSEREKLKSFIKEGIASRTGGCLYVSGPPGTGKSAMVHEVCHEMDLSSLKLAHVNCASMRCARDVYGKLIEDLGDDGQVFKKSEADRLKALFLPDKKKDDLFLVTLDEIDHLLTADAGVLQSLFEWSLHGKSCLMLVGIANALDLTDRSLPQLKAKNLKPRLLPFLPYNAGQIANVISNRLRSLIPADLNPEPNFVPFVQPNAIQLCAKKVASQTGDLRKAFELVKRAIDLIEQETLQKLEKQKSNTHSPSKTILVENNNLSSPARTAACKQQPTHGYTTLTAPRASIAHVARITSAAFGQGTVQRLQALNLQQKAALCALIALDRKRRDGEIFGTTSKSKISAPTIKQVFDTYCTLCRADNILHPLTATEFKDVISNLETLGLVGEFQGRGRGGTVAGGSDIRRTPSKSMGGPMTPRKGMDEQGLVCFVSQKEIESQIDGPGEGILKRLLMGQGL